jgi:hypothetical protein
MASWIRHCSWLAKYRMVHFATHGALAGELKGPRDPASS